MKQATNNLRVHVVLQFFRISLLVIFVSWFVVSCQQNGNGNIILHIPAKYSSTATNTSSTLTIILTNAPGALLTNYPAPVLTNVPAPLFTNFPAPALTNIGAPVLTNIPAPTATNKPAEILTNVPAPIRTNIVAPIFSNYPAPILTNYAAPVLTNYPAPLFTNFPAPTLTNFPALVATNIPAPAVTNVMAPALTNFTAPVFTNYPAPAMTNFPAPELTNLVQNLHGLTKLLKSEPGLLRWDNFWHPYLVMALFGAIGGLARFLLDYGQIIRLKKPLYPNSPRELNDFLKARWLSGGPLFDLLMALITGAFAALLVPGVLYIYDEAREFAVHSPIEGILEKAAKNGFLLLPICSLCVIAGLTGQPFIVAVRNNVPRLMKGAMLCLFKKCCRLRKKKKTGNQ